MSPFILLVGASLSLGAPITLQEALEAADTHSPTNQAASWGVVAAKAKRDQMRAHFMPNVTAEATALRWDEELLLDFGGGGEPVDCSQIPPPMDALCKPFAEPSVIREQTTEQYQVTAVQPLSGLYAIYEGHRATSLLAKAAENDMTAQRSAVRVQVVDAYLGALKADQLLEVAHQGRASLEAHVGRATAFHTAELLLHSDLLQLKVALAHATLGEQRLEDAVVLARRQLAMLVGAKGTLDPAPIPLGDVPALVVSGNDSAFETRPEALALDRRYKAAKAGRNAARADLVPQVAALGTWTRTEGQGTFAAPESWFVGMSAKWQLFGGGQKYYAIREASAGARQAESGLVALKMGLALEIEASLNEARATRRAYEVSRDTVDQAEENLRLVSARFDHQLASANDLLDAETLAAQSRAERISSFYDHLSAIGKAQKALGQQVDPQGGIKGSN